MSEFFPRFARISFSGLITLGVSLCTVGCNEPPEDPVTNKVLNRPTDMALVCLRVNCAGTGPDEPCATSMEGLEQCQADSAVEQPCRPSGTHDSYHLIGFLADSGTNEVALFNQCAHDRSLENRTGTRDERHHGSLVDMDPEVPGFNFIPVGGMPVEMAAESPTPCRITTANAATCDFSVLDAEALAGYAVGVAASGGTVTTIPDAEGSGEESGGAAADAGGAAGFRAGEGEQGGRGTTLVRRLSPLRFDESLAEPAWVPLGVSPATIISPPRSLLDDRVDLIGEDRGSVCSPDRPGSVIATFPSCNLIAEIDLVTGRIVQSMTLEIDENGEVEGVLTGSSPSCQVLDCPVPGATTPKLDDGLPDDGASESETVDGGTTGAEVTTGVEESSGEAETGADATGTGGEGSGSEGGTTGYAGQIVTRSSDWGPRMASQAPRIHSLRVEQLAAALAEGLGDRRTGFGPIALALVTDEDARTDPLTTPEQTPAADSATLYIGGSNSPRLVSLRIEGGRWDPEIAQIELGGARSIGRIRVAPPVRAEYPVDGSAPQFPLQQFLYVIAGDGSTRVVLRNFDPTTSGTEIECDAQTDTQSAVALDTLCVPVTADTAGPLNRRALADGPGIRAPGGSRVLDWAFYRVPNREQDAGLDEGSTIFADRFRYHIVGMGSTSEGGMVFSSFGQYVRPSTNKDDTPNQDHIGIDDYIRIFEQVVQIENKSQATAVPFDMVGLMPTKLSAHMLEPLDGLGRNPSPESPDGLPRLADSEAPRSITRGSNISARLAPSLRLVDSAYTRNLPDTSPLVGFTQDLDNLGVARTADDGSRENRLYSDDVPRIMGRDLRSWLAGNWSIEWEGVIPLSRSDRGRIECSNDPNLLPGGDTEVCLPGPDGGSKLVDDTVNFCDLGILPGDKLVLNGCRSSEDCGVGRICVLDGSAVGQSVGICTSQSISDDDRRDLISACSEFLDDPCADYRRQYEITKASRHELELGVIRYRERAHVRQGDGCDGDGQPAHAHLEAGSCMCDEGYTPVYDQIVCAKQAQSPSAVTPGAILPGVPPTCCLIDATQLPGSGTSLVQNGEYFSSRREVIDRYTCAEIQPEGGCLTDSDCSAEAPPELLTELLGHANGEDAQLASAALAGLRALDRVCEERRCRRPCLSADDAEAIAASPTVAQRLSTVPDLNLNSDRCTVRLLPGKKCFDELVNYELRTRNGFLVRGPTLRTGFFTDQVVENEAGECTPVDPALGVSTLLTSRIPLPANGEGLASYPVCPEGGVVGPRDPNPCLITTPRSETVNNGGISGAARFHVGAYGVDAVPVPALRFSNPSFSFVLDLVSLKDLQNPVPGTGGRAYWPPSAAEFQRARIPAGYAQTFGANLAYQVRHDAFNLGLDNGLRVIRTTYPIKLQLSPIPWQFYVLDGADLRTGGKVLKFGFAGPQIQADVDFDGVR